MNNKEKRQSGRGSRKSFRGKRADEMPQFRDTVPLEAEMHDVQPSAPPAELMRQKSTARIKIKDVEQMQEVGDEEDLGFTKVAKKKARKFCPIVIPIIILLEIALLVVSYVYGGVEISSFVKNPLISLPNDVLLRFGARSVTLMKPPNYQIWRVFSCMVLHSGALHLFWTVVWQLQTAATLEYYWGFFRIGPIYILSGAGGYLLSGLFLPKEATVGASPCLAGLYGALVADVILNWTVLPNPIRSLLIKLFQVFMLLLFGVIPFVDNYAQIGGAFVGFFLGLALLPSLVERKLIYNILISAFALVVVVVFFVICIIVFFGVVNLSCEPCYYLSPSWDILFPPDADGW